MVPIWLVVLIATLLYLVTTIKSGHIEVLLVNSLLSGIVGACVGWYAINKLQKRIEDNTIYFNERRRYLKMVMVVVAVGAIYLAGNYYKSVCMNAAVEQQLNMIDRQYYCISSLNGMHVGLFVVPFIIQLFWVLFYERKHHGPIYIGHRL